MKKAGRWEVWVPTKGLLRTVLVVEGGGGLGAGGREEGCRKGGRADIHPVPAMARC